MGIAPLWVPRKQAGLAVAGKGYALPFSENKQGRTEGNYWALAPWMELPMTVKGLFNVSCDALECSAMGEGNTVWYFWFFLSTCSSEGKLLLPM